MTPEDVLRKAQSAKDCAVSAADALSDFIDQLKTADSHTSDEAAEAYMRAVGHIRDALTALDELGTRKSTSSDG